jgi:preprotein translocase SecE subunit
MVAFWALFLLMAYGCLGGFVLTLRSLLGGINESLTKVWVPHFPLVGRIDLAVALGAAALGVTGLLIHRYLNRPKVADLLIETESELKKVTWPTPGETWTGSIAVVITVVVLLAYLSLADIFLVFVLSRAMGGRA